MHVTGAFDDLPSVYAALNGVWGAWVNTDGFTVGEVKELFAGMRIFELAKQIGTVRHYVWSNLDYSFKASDALIFLSSLSVANVLAHCRKEDTIRRTASSTTTARAASASGCRRSRRLSATTICPGASSRLVPTWRCSTS